jgi:HEAT repeat protein
MTVGETSLVAAAALGRISDAQAVELLIMALKDDDSTPSFSKNRLRGAWRDLR